MIFIALLCFFAVQPLVAQEVVKMRFLNARFKEVEAAKAKYSETVLRNEDGTLTFQRKFLKGDVIIRSETYKGEEPVGRWFYAKENGELTQEFDYDFLLSYEAADCRNSYLYTIGADTLGANVPGHFTAPKLMHDKGLHSFIAAHLTYPEAAREAGIDGRVIIRGVISETGNFEEAWVVKGVHKGLDKEAARVLRKARFSPPMLDGKPVRLCVTVPIKFALE